MPQSLERQMRDLQLTQIMQVVTIPEAARHWQKHEMSIRRAIDEGRLVARKSGSTWLVSISSLRQLWGPAAIPLDPPVLPRAY